MADMYTLHFAAQLKLNKFNVYRIFRIQTYVIEKTENNAQFRNYNIYFLMCTCNYAAKLTVRLFSAFKGAYLPGLLTETNLKFSHTNCISNNILLFFQCHVLKGSCKWTDNKHVRFLIQYGRYDKLVRYS